MAKKTVVKKTPPKKVSTSHKSTLAQRIATDPKLKAKYLSNPGLRSKLPASALSPVQRQTRETNARLNAPSTPGSSLTNRAVANQADAATTVRYGDATDELTKAGSQARQLGTDQQGWYANFQREMDTHAQNTNAINAQATQQIGALGAGIRGLDQANANQQTAASQADAASRGATAADTSQDDSHASAVRQAMVAIQGAQQAGIGASASRYADTAAHVVTPIQGLQAGARNQQRQRDIGEKKVSLAKQRGAFNAQTRAGIVADEAKTVLANQALGLNASKAASTASLGRARIKASTATAGARLAETHTQNEFSRGVAKTRLELERERVAIAKTNAAKTAKSGKGAAATHRDNNKVRSAITTAAADARFRIGKTVPVRGVDGKVEADDQGKPTGRMRPVTPTEIRAFLRGQYKDADVANAAMDLAINGHVSAENVRRLKARGIAIPKSWTQAPAKAKPKVLVGVKGSANVG